MNDCAKNGEASCERCEAEKCVTDWQEPAHYMIVTGGKRKCYCGPCFLKAEHELQRRLAEEKAILKVREKQ